MNYQEEKRLDSGRAKNLWRSWYWKTTNG